MTKAEKRRQLQAIKEAARQEKAVRLRERPSDALTIRVGANPGAGKAVRASKNPDSIMALHLTWCESRSDQDGSWTWGTRAWSQEDWDKHISPAFQAFEALTWAELLRQETGGKSSRHRKHHDMPVEVITDEAQDRWKELGLEQYDTAFRFRLGNKQRAWGFRLRSHFHFVWWDPEHNIYPVEP